MMFHVNSQYGKKKKINGSGMNKSGTPDLQIPTDKANREAKKKITHSQLLCICGKDNLKSKHWVSSAVIGDEPAIRRRNRLLVLTDTYLQTRSLKERGEGESHSCNMKHTYWWKLESPHFPELFFWRFECKRVKYKEYKSPIYVHWALSFVVVAVL